MHIVTSSIQNPLEIKTLYKRLYQLEAGIRVNGARCRCFVPTFSGAQARARACARGGYWGVCIFFRRPSYTYIHPCKKILSLVSSQFVV